MQLEAGGLGLTHPVPDIEEALFASEIKQEEEAHGVSEKGRRQTPKPETTETKYPA